MITKAYEIKPFFIDCEHGKLFAMYYYPVSGNISQCIIHVPAFFEEMNKSRHMVAMQARAFAQQGYSVLVLDLFGTGDSHGEFGEATWVSWLQNIESALEWLKLQGVKSISFWGLRSGVLLALDFLQQYDHQIDRLICWQPVLNGETFMMQFLRLRIAAAMMNKNAPQEKTSDLKRQLQEGRNIEVAGYCLNPDLVNPMLALKARQLNAINVKRYIVFELVADKDDSVSHACMQWIQLLKESNRNVLLDTVLGSSFWATQEILEVPELISRTKARVVSGMDFSPLK